MSQVQVGFGRADLWGTWATSQPLVDEIDVRALAAVNDRDAGVVAVADVCGMWPATCRRLRGAVAAALGVPEARVGIFCTQNHGAPMEGPEVYDLDRWEAAFVEAAQQAWAAVRPAHMAVVETEPSPPGLFRRRLSVGALGHFTFYFGFGDDGSGRALAADLLGLALHGLVCGPEGTVRCPVDASGWPPPAAALPVVPADTALEAAHDPLLQGLFFRTPDGESIGSLSRWAAHPVTANRPGAGHSGDYPVYLRRRLAAGFGGDALFLTGPCGDQAPLVGDKSSALARRVGTQAADHLLQGLAAATWHPLETMWAGSRNVTLPVRGDYPGSAAAAAASLAALRRRLAAAREGLSREGRVAWSSLARLKRLSEEIERLGYTAAEVHFRWCGLRPEALRGSGIAHPLFALRLGDAVVAGLPGEPFGCYSRTLRRRWPGRSLLVTEEANGYLSYLPPAAEYGQGGYGPAAAILDPEAEAILLDQVSGWLASLG